MHLLHVISSMDPVNGGPNQGIRNLDGVMKASGVDREVICLDDPDSQFLKLDTFKTHAVARGVSAWHYSSKLMPWLTANLSRFDFVIINGLWQYHSYATWKAIKKLKKKYPGRKLPHVLVMPHGMLDPYFQKAKERRLKAIRNWFYWKLIEREVVNEADGLLFTCETEMLLARETFTGYRPKKEYNVGYGIEPPPVYHAGMTTAFNDSCPGLKGRPYLLFLSRIHPKKGIDLLLRAYIELGKELVSAGKELPCLVIAGPGMDTGFGMKLEHLMRGSGLGAHVFFTGMLVSDAKWGAFYGCEAFILPSHQENFGIAVAEALACRKPVLISNQVNIWREIFHEQAGIVEDDSYEGTKSLLIKWSALNTKKRNQMGESALYTFKRYFEIASISVRLFAVFSELHNTEKFDSDPLNLNSVINR